MKKKGFDDNAFYYDRLRNRPSASFKSSTPRILEQQDNGVPAPSAYSPPTLPRDRWTSGSKDPQSHEQRLSSSFSSTKNHSSPGANSRLSGSSSFRSTLPQRTSHSQTAASHVPYYESPGSFGHSKSSPSSAFLSGTPRVCDKNNRSVRRRERGDKTPDPGAYELPSEFDDKKKWCASSSFSKGANRVSQMGRYNTRGWTEPASVSVPSSFSSSRSKKSGSSFQSTSERLQPSIWEKKSFKEEEERYKRQSNTGTRTREEVRRPQSALASSNSRSTGSAAFRSTSIRFKTKVSDTPIPGKYDPRYDFLSPRSRK